MFRSASGCLSAQVDLVILHGDGPNGPSDDAVTPYLDASADATETRLRVVYTLATGEVLGSISIALEEQNLVTVAADGTPTCELTLTTKGPIYSGTFSRR